MIATTNVVPKGLSVFNYLFLRAFHARSRVILNHVLMKNIRFLLENSSRKKSTMKRDAFCEPS